MCNTKLGKFNENCYSIKLNTELEKLNDISSKQLYWNQMSGKEINRIWEGKWNNILRYYTLDMEMDEWERIWESIHDSIIPYEI